MSRVQPKQPPNIFQYTNNVGPLTIEQRAFYEENGFLIVRSVFDRNELEPIAKHYFDICRNPSAYCGKVCGNLVRDINIADKTIDTSHLAPEFSYIKLNTFAGPAGRDEIFHSYVENPKLKPFIQQFICPVDKNETLITQNGMMVVKPPGLGQTGSESTRHPLHQDLYYFARGERDAEGNMTEKENDGIVCAWTAIGTCNRDNGCLCFLPGSHKKGLRKHQYPEWDDKHNQGYLGIQDLSAYEIDRRIHAEMESGDVVFFHPQTIHGSGVNRRTIEDAKVDPDAFRKAITVHYRRKSLTEVDLSELPVGKQGYIEGLRPKDLLRDLGKYLSVNSEDKIVQLMSTIEGRKIIHNANERFRDKMNYNYNFNFQEVKWRE